MVATAGTYTLVVTGANGCTSQASADVLLDADAPGASATGGTLTCDVTSLEDCRAAIGRVVDARGGVDVLINNAGVTHLGRFAETDVEVIRRVVEVNFFGSVNCTKAALDSLIERRGRIAVLSSVAGFSPLATRCGYSASKHALHGFFDSMRPELRPSGVSVTLVCPFFVKTDMGSRALGPDGGKPRMERTQTGTASDPDWLADEIHKAVRNRRRLLVPAGGAKLSYVVSRILPGTYERLMARRIM